MTQQEILINFLSRKIFLTFTDQLIMINPKAVSCINKNYAEVKECDRYGQPIKWRQFIQIIYKNGQTDELPINEQNLKMADELLDSISKLDEITPAAVPKIDG